MCFFESNKSSNLWKVRLVDFPVLYKETRWISRKTLDFLKEGLPVLNRNIFFIKNILSYVAKRPVFYEKTYHFY